MDILRVVSDSELDFVIERIKDNLPRNARSLNFIQAARRSRELWKNNSDVSEKLLPVFYTHRFGVKENCTIFAISGERDHLVWFFTLEEAVEEVKHCLENSKLIHWNKKLLFVTIHEEHTGIVLDVIKKKGCILIEDENAVFYILDREEALQFDVS